MKANIHPTYHPNAQVKCACGQTFVAGSTREEVEIELCSNCHPFYTGKQKIVDTARRVEKFQLRADKVDTDSVAKKREKAVKRAAAKKEEK